MASSAAAMLALQTAVITRLKASYAVTALVAASAIYDAVPQDAPYPRVVWDEPSEIPDRTFGQNGHEITFRLTVQTQDASPTAARSGSAGFKCGLEIAEAVLAAIGGAYPDPEGFEPLTFDDYDLVDLDVLGVNAAKLDDGVSRDIDITCVAFLEASS